MKGISRAPIPQQLPLRTNMKADGNRFKFVATIRTKLSICYIKSGNVFVARRLEMVDNVTHFIVIRFYSDSGFVNVWDNIQNILN